MTMTLRVVPVSAPPCSEDTLEPAYPMGRSPKLMFAIRLCWGFTYLRRKGGAAVDVALIIIVAVLIALVVVIIVRGQRASRPVREREQAAARVTAGKAEAQHEESLRRQAGVRAAYPERHQEADSDPDE
jgi:hypothetical protein